MKITLGDKEYIQTKKPKARMVRKALEIAENMEEIKAESLDDIANYVAELYGNQFTMDDIYDELDADQLMPTLMKCIDSIVGTMGAKLEKFPNKKAE